MALNLTQKQEVVAELAAVAGAAHSLVAAEYAGLTVEQLTGLRRKARDEGVFIKVAKNTLVSRAVEGTDYAVVKDALTGPLLYAFSQEDPGAAGRLIKEFAKANDKLKPRLVAVGGQMYPGSHVDVLASLPTREQALSMLLSVMVQPATMLVRLLSEPAAQVARVINAAGQQKAA
jgi:large subunit ribosomal protein L10